ncbi:MAG: DNA-3-methyladenine glycosylase I [Burkholderiaceae bacterium]|nr:DNA-3-methyladenine glycosylase I [Burkholderiaceae bacterium]
MANRCHWCGDDPLYMAYHDEEWGVPAHDDQRLFEMLILEGAQAGLSWITVLRKREAYRKAFDKFNVKRVAAYGEDKIAQLMQDEGIVRNRLKIRSAVNNAQRFIEVQKEFGSFDAYLWAFVDGKPLQNSYTGRGSLPASTEISDRLSKDLKKRGFNFVGSTIIYAFMQACGMVNDHLVECDWHKKTRKLSK